MKTAALSSPDDTVISVRNVSKQYKLYSSHKDRLKEALHPFRKTYHEIFQALADINFDVASGQSVGLLGRNGAGKSTLLQLIAGVLTPSGGMIQVSGHVAALLELGAGFNPDLTGRENVILANTINGIPKNELGDRVALVEEFADIGVFFDQPMRIYSSGMFARVAFANAIHVNPAVLIIDEILGVGDAKFQEKCYSTIRKLRDRGVSILFVSHSTEVIQRNCETALLLEAGRVVANGPADEVVAAYHDLLYGSQKNQDKKVVVSSSPTISENTGKLDLDKFLQGMNGSLYRNFGHYNRYERRLGNNDAEIIDFVVSADDDFQFGLLQGNEKLMIYLKIKFNRKVEFPHIGWAIVSKEGIVIAGSNTSMCTNTEIPFALAGQMCIYAIEIFPTLCGGNYFVNIGMMERHENEFAYLDVRRSVIHFDVADSGRSTGFFEFPSKYYILNVRASQ